MPRLEESNAIVRQAALHNEPQKASRLDIYGSSRLLRSMNLVTKLNDELYIKVSSHSRRVRDIQRQFIK
jgi:hypothetical protein